MKKGPSPKKSTKEVNTLIHNLRGEDFRHARNLQKSPSQRVTSPSTFTVHISGKPTLPFSEIFGEREEEEDRPQREDPFRPQAAPRFNVESSSKGKGKEGISFWEENTPEWREDALSTLFEELPLAEDDNTPFRVNKASELGDPAETRDIPPLTLLCLQALLDMCSRRQFIEDVIPHLPTHLRRVLLRWTAIHSPLTNSKVYALCEPDGSVDGELIIVGPQASLRDDLFNSPTHPDSDQPPHTTNIEHSFPDGPPVLADRTGEEEDLWDTPSSSSDASLPLISLALLATSLPTLTLLTFPPTLTHIALLGLSAPIPLYHLTRTCPQLELLDLSYNPWLPHTYISGPRGLSALERIQWSRWNRLRVLGLKQCGITWDIGKDVNKGRWVDVSIIGIDLDLAAKS